jgi:hypothetical protein
MTIIALEAGTKATYGLEFFSSTFQTVSSSADTARSGSRSLKITGGTNPSWAQLDTSMSATGRLSAYVRFTATGSGGLFFMLNNGGTRFGLGRNSSNQIIVLDGANTRGTGSTVVPNDTWTRIEIAYSLTSSSVNSVRVFIGSSAVADISLTNITWTDIVNGTYLVGAGNGVVTYFDDIYHDDDSSLTTAGDIRVTAKLPDALSTNNFDTLVGSGTNRYDRVSERPLSVTNGIQHAAISDVYETFQVQAPSVGDVDVSDKHIVGYSGWIYAKRGDIDTAVVTEIGSVQTKVSTHTTTVIPTTNDMVSTGNAIVVVFACDDNGNPGTTATCADSKGNTYTAANGIQASATGSATGVRSAIFIALNATALTGADTITVTHGAVVASAAGALEVQKLQTSTPLDSSGSKIQSSGSPIVTGEIGTMSQEGCFVVSAIGVETNTSADFNSTDDTVTAEASWLSTGTTGGGAAANIWLRSKYGRQSTILTSGHHGFTMNTARDATSVIAVYKGTAGAFTYGSPKLVVNGNETGVTLTTVNNVYTAIGSGNPYSLSGSLTVGMRSPNASPDTYLYECGVLVAWDESKGHLSNLRRRKPINIRV